MNRETQLHRWILFAFLWSSKKYSLYCFLAHKGSYWIDRVLSDVPVTVDFLNIFTFNLSVYLFKVSYEKVTNLNKFLFVNFKGYKAAKSWKIKLFMFLLICQMHSFMICVGTLNSKKFTFWSRMNNPLLQISCNIGFRYFMSPFTLDINKIDSLMWYRIGPLLWSHHIMYRFYHLVHVTWNI